MHRKYHLLCEQIQTVIKSRLNKSSLYVFVVANLLLDLIPKAAGNMLNFIYFFQKNKAWQYMWQFMWIG